MILGAVSNDNLKIFINCTDHLNQLFYMEKNDYFYFKSLIIKQNIENLCLSDNFSIWESFAGKNSLVSYLNSISVNFNSDVDSVIETYIFSKNLKQLLELIIQSKKCRCKCLPCSYIKHVKSLELFYKTSKSKNYTQIVSKSSLTKSKRFVLDSIIQISALDKELDSFIKSYCSF